MKPTQFRHDLCSDLGQQSPQTLAVFDGMLCIGEQLTRTAPGASYGLDYPSWASWRLAVACVSRLGTNFIEVLMELKGDRFAEFTV
jgi:hypothetical protein